ncbi:hypothetical protein D3C74_356500 [compost metagenome]
MVDTRCGDADAHHPDEHPPGPVGQERGREAVLTAAGARAADDLEGQHPEREVDHGLADRLGPEGRLVLRVTTRPGDGLENLPDPEGCERDDGEPQDERSPGRARDLLEGAGLVGLSAARSRRDPDRDDPDHDVEQAADRVPGPGECPQPLALLKPLRGP